jgi:hypothetical protein
MTAELHADDRAALPATEAPDHDGRPTLSGDLPTLFRAGPMFRRIAVGYDRFQVDTYVQWAEEELATAEREHERLLTRHVETRAALEEARGLLAHSAGGAELVRVSGRIAAMLAAAADEAETMRVEADAEASAVSAAAQATLADAQKVRAAAAAEAQRTIAGATAEAEELVASAGRIVDDAELTRSEARLEAEARLAKIAALELRAAQAADQVRQNALEEAAAARLHARAEIAAMLATAREERRRADEAATASRTRLDDEASTRRVALLAEVEELERRRAALRAALKRQAGQTPAPARQGLRDHLERFRHGLAFTGLHWRPVATPSAPVATANRRSRTKA